MGWFSKKGKEDIDNDIDNGFTLPLDDINLTELNSNGTKKDSNFSGPVARHALTPDEVLGKNTDKPKQVWETEQIPMAGGKTVEVNSATVLLYKRMMESKAAAQTQENEPTDKPITTTESYIVKPATTLNDKETPLTNTTKLNSVEPGLQATLKEAIKETTQEKNNNEPTEQTEIEFLDIKSKEQDTPKENKELLEVPTLTEQNDTIKDDALTQQKSNEQPAQTLLSRCMPYIIDDNGHNHSEDFPPAYTLESVEDIISAFENKAAQKVSEMYGTTAVTPPTKNLNTPVTDNKQPSFKVKPLQRKSRSVSKPLEQTPKSTPLDIPVTHTGVYSDPTDQENSIKTYQASFSTIEIPVTTLNDGDQSTITFDINDIRRATGDDLGATKQIVISDIGAEKKESIEKFIAPQSSDFDEIIDDLNGYTCFDDAKRVRIELYKAKRKNLLKFFFTAIITLLITLMRLPVFDDLLFGKSNTVCLISCIALAVLGIINIKTLLSVKNIFKGCQSTNIPVSLSVLCVLLHSVLTLTFFNTAEVLNLAPLGALALCFSSMCDFLRSAEIVDNFRYVASPNQKSAIDIIKNQETTSKIISTGLEGKPYIIAPRKTVNLLGFLKASYAPNPVTNQMPVFTIVILAAAVAIGVATFFVLNNFASALSAFTIAVCLGFSPIIQLVGALPTKAMSARLAKHGAFVCGYDSAMSVEPANCVALNAADLFPNGTIELINMKILGNNSLDKTFFDAASITASAQSPLYNVFKDITKSSDDAIPLCDSVKYEDKMGVSGWVDDRHIFIGNRTLLEAHSIAVPSVEVDKKILKKGYFPVYVACNGKAYALLMVRYIPKRAIKHQLMRLASMGVTFYLNSTDPNINTHMVIDYFGLFDDSVYSLKSDQIKNFKEATNYKESCFAPACFRGGIDGLLAVIVESIKLKICVNVMKALNIMCSVLGIVALIFAVCTGSFSVITTTILIVWQLISAIIGMFALFIK